MHTLAHRLAEYAVGLEFRSSSRQQSSTRSKRRVLDSLACALGAWDAEPCAIAPTRCLRGMPCKHGATL